MEFNSLTRGGRMVLLAGGLLAVDLISFPWHRGTVLTPYGPAFVRATGIESPNAFYGVVALFLAIGMVVQVVLSVTTVALPRIPVSWAQVQLGAGVAALVLLILKLIAEPRVLSTGAILGIPVAGVLAYGAYILYQESRTGGPPRGYGGH